MVCVPLVVCEGLQGGTQIGLIFVFIHIKYIHCYSFHLSSSVNKFLNFYVFTLLVFKNYHFVISHSHFVHVTFQVSILVFQTFDCIIVVRLIFPGTRLYVVTVRDPQMVCYQKKFGNCWPKKSRTQDVFMMLSSLLTVISKRWL